MSALQDAVKRFQSQQASLAAHNLTHAPGKPPAAKRKPVAKKPPPAGTAGGVGTGRSTGGGAQPLGKAIKDVLDHLRLQGEAVEVDVLADVLGVDLSETGPLLAALCRNDKVTVHPDGSLQYKAKHQAKNKQQLLKVMSKHSEGIPLAELQEAYPAAVADIAASLKDGKLYRLYNLDLDPGRNGTAGWMLYYRDPELEMKVSPELAELWRKTEIPRDPAELDAALTAAMLEPMIKDRKRKPVAKVPKERRKRKESQLRKVTNVHMPELFQGAAPTQID